MILVGFDLAIHSAASSQPLDLDQVAIGWLQSPDYDPGRRSVTTKLAMRSFESLASAESTVISQVSQANSMHLTAICVARGKPEAGCYLRTCIKRVHPRSFLHPLQEPQFASLYPEV